MHQKPWHAVKMVTWGCSVALGDEHRKDTSLICWRSKARQDLNNILINYLFMQDLERDPEVHARVQYKAHWLHLVLGETFGINLSFP